LQGKTSLKLITFFVYILLKNWEGQLDSLELSPQWLAQEYQSRKALATWEAWDIFEGFS